MKLKNVIRYTFHETCIYCIKRTMINWENPNMLFLLDFPDFIEK
jgi:hypothetical protein